MSTVTLRDKIDWEDETADLAARLLVAAWQADGHQWRMPLTVPTEAVASNCFIVAEAFVAQRRKRREMITYGAPQKHRGATLSDSAATPRFSD